MYRFARGTIFSARTFLPLMSGTQPVSSNISEASSTCSASSSLVVSLIMTLLIGRISPQCSVNCVAYPAWSSSAVGEDDHDTPDWAGSRGKRPSLCLRLLEIAQVGWPLVLLGRHQQAVVAEEIVVLADDDMRIVLRANVLAPPDGLLGRNAAVVLRDGPRTRQGAVDHGDLVVEDVGIGAVEIEAFLDDGLPIFVERDAARLIDPRALEPAGLDQKRVVAAGALAVDPSADGIAGKHRVVGHVRGPFASVGVDSAIVVNMLDQDVGRFGRHHDLHRRIGMHDARHAGRQAKIGRIVALSALCLVSEARLMDRPVLGRERRLLSPAGRLGGIVAAHAAIAANPLALEIDIFRVIPGSRACDCQAKCRGKRDGCDRTSIWNDWPPEIACRWCGKAATVQASRLSMPKAAETLCRRDYTSCPAPRKRQHFANTPPAGRFTLAAGSGGGRPGRSAFFKNYGQKSHARGA